MVDYSKWDNLSCSDSEDDDPVKVTRMDEPKSVTFGPQGVSVSPSAKPSEATKSITPRPKVTPSDIEKVVSSWSSNGINYSYYLWAQTQQEVVIRIVLPVDSRSKDVTVTLTTNGLLSCSYKKVLVLSGQLTKDVWGAPNARTTAHPDCGPVANALWTNATEELKEGKAMDWGLEDPPTGLTLSSTKLKLPDVLAPTTSATQKDSFRLLVVRLTKLALNDMVREEWWEKCLVEETDVVAVEEIPGRKKHGAKEFQKAWEEAQKEFIQRRKNTKKVSV